ncbi:MAG: hypothetical protein NZ903_02040 [Candidatus Micrarchaeota archaeon]|nr:hypothetical protein [Candidatus Micrarchaeota archaeon]
MKATLRESYRYIAVEIFSEIPLSKEDLAGILREDLLTFIGKIYYSKVMPKLVYFDPFKQKAIIRCLTGGTEDLKTALALLNKWNGRSIHLKAFFTSGTIKKAKERIK